MNNTTYAFLLTTFAGFSTMLGMFPIFLKLKNKNRVISFACFFACFVMSFVSITSLIPEGLLLIKTVYTNTFSIMLCTIFFVIGVIISMTIDKFIDTNDTKNNKLYKVGLISMLAIIMHNIPEGIATFMASNTDRSLGLTLAIAISLHNIPEGISISIPIFYSTKSKKKAFLYTFISALSEPFGALITYLFLSRFINDFIMGLLLCSIAGIMIHIAIYELFPTALKYRKLNNSRF